MTYVLSREAVQAIEDIEDYTAINWGDAQARIYIEALFDAFLKLDKNPQLGRTRPDVPPSFRVYSVGSHLIVYRENQMVGRLEVLTVIHSAMNIEARILELLRSRQK